MKPAKASRGVMPKRDMPGYVARFLTDKSNGTFYELMQKYSDDGFTLPEPYKRVMAFKDEMCSAYNMEKAAARARGGSGPQEQPSGYGKQRRRKKYNGPKAFRFRF